MRAHWSQSTKAAVTEHEFRDQVIRQVRRVFGLSVFEFNRAVDAGRLNRFDELVSSCLDNLKRAGLRP